MAMVEGISTGVPLASHPRDDPAKVRDAAQQFESLLLAQILKAVHEGDGDGWLGTGEDQASQAAMGLAQEQFAQALAKSGGLGLSKLIVTGLERER